MTCAGNDALPIAKFISEGVGGVNDVMSGNVLSRKHNNIARAQTYSHQKSSPLPLNTRFIMSSSYTCTYIYL